MHPPGLTESLYVPGLQAGPPSNFTIHLRLPSGEVRPYRMPRQFFAAHPSKWRAWTSTPSLHLEMWAEFAQWHGEGSS